jgi:LysM repeat protein
MNKLTLLSIFFTLSFIKNSAATTLDSLRLEKKDGKNFVIHKVNKGQTLFGTLRKYGTTLSEFKAANPGIDTDIKIDQILRIPYFKAIKETKKTPEKVAVNTKSNPSKSSDTLFLKVENEQVINFDSYFYTPPKVVVVESGNTLFKIAKKTGTKVPEIKKLNNLETDLIEVGQVLIVKDGIALKGKPQQIIDFEENRAIRNFKLAEALTASKAATETEPEQIKNPQKEVIVVQKDAVKVVDKPADKIEEKKQVIPPKVEVVKKPEPVVVKEPAPVKPVIKDTLPVNKPVIAKKEEILTAEDIENTSPRSIKVEEGIAEIIEVESKSGKYLALHKSAPLGTLVQVRNETNGASVWVKVIGRLPEVDQNQNIIIKLSPKAMVRVSPVDKRFRAKINYSL